MPRMNDIIIDSFLS